jgi:hypothetical protein
MAIRKSCLILPSVDHIAIALLILSWSCLTLRASAEDAPTSKLDPPAVAKSTGAVGDTEGLQKAVQNPVASLISFPLQNNTNFDLGPNRRIQNVLNLQPVIPVHMAGNWNLIIRWITPIISQPDLTQKDTSIFGFGDMLPTFFFSPAKPKKLIWGAGPAFLLPSATNQKVLGQGKFGMGPSFVALIQPSHWTIGALVNNVWSVAGPSSRADVNQMTLQYFINYNLRRGWYLTTSPVLTANWEATKGNRWVVPLGGGAGRVFRLGFQPVNVSAAIFGNAVRPAGSSPWGMRLQIALLFPKVPKKD